MTTTTRSTGLVAKLTGQAEDPSRPVGRPATPQVEIPRNRDAYCQTTIFSSSQGQFMVRAYTARICGADIANIRAIPAEIGGGFGGKTIIYLEPLAYMLSKN